MRSAGCANGGSPRIVEDLREADTRTSKRYCARLMRDHGLRGRKKHSRRSRTTDRRPAQPVAANLLAKRPAPTGPNPYWLTDLTALQTAEGGLYLAAILERESRHIVGWAGGPARQASLVLAALADALKRRQPPTGLWHHSDRGSQHADEDYIAALGAAGSERRMGRQWLRQRRAGLVLEHPQEEPRARSGDFRQPPPH